MFREIKEELELQGYETRSLKMKFKSNDAVLTLRRTFDGYDFEVPYDLNGMDAQKLMIAFANNRDPIEFKNGNELLFFRAKLGPDKRIYEFEFSCILHKNPESHLHEFLCFCKKFYSFEFKEASVNENQLIIKAVFFEIL